MSGTVNWRMKDLADVKTNMEDADFWLQRKGSEKNVGKVTKEFSAENIGVKFKVGKKPIHVPFMYYMMEHVHVSGYWRRYSYGSLPLKNIRVSDVKNLTFALQDDEESEEEKSVNQMKRSRVR